MLTLVTAYYSVPTIHHRTDDEYWMYFDRLVHAKIPLIVFLDPLAYQTFQTRYPMPFDHLTICPIPPLHTDWLPLEISIPSKRNVTKDNADYFCIQLMKLFFLKEALSRTLVDFLAWVDFGIFHMIRDIPLAYARMQDLTTRSLRRDRILAAGVPWYPVKDLWNEVCWKFCGSFLLGYRDLFLDAYDIQMQIVQEHLPQLTWEVNYWVLMREKFHIFPSNHNDAILDVPLWCFEINRVYSDPEIINMVKPFTSVSKERIQNVLDLVERCIQEEVPGDLIEIGVWRGGLLMAMAWKCQQLGISRTIRGYDTFQGMTPPQIVDQDLFGNKAIDIFDQVSCICPKQEVQSHVDILFPGFHNIHLHQGDITKIQLEQIPTPIALLRLDTDWYSSTRFGLSYFTPFVSEYGYVIVDDYGHWKGAQKAVQEYHPPSLQRIDYTGVWWQVDYGRRIIQELCSEFPHCEYLATLQHHFHHFISLHHVLGRRFIRGCGSYLFDGQVYRYQRDTWKKQEALFRIGKQCHRILEVGVYVGHSLLILLLSNPSLRIDCIDIDGSLPPKAVEYLSQQFGDRVKLTSGPAIEVLKSWVSKGPYGNPRYDGIHIDADHDVPAVVDQFLLTRLLALPQSYFVFDDYEAVRSCIDSWINKGVLDLVELPGGLWTNIITRLCKGREGSSIQ